MTREYVDGKYAMQDVNCLYVGCKYTFGEVVEDEDIPFRFRMILERYIFPEVNEEDTLESHFYYLPDKGLSFKIYRQLGLRVKVNLIEERSSLWTGRKEKKYVTKIMPIGELAAMSPSHKESMGVVIQELVVGKLALMAF